MRVQRNHARRSAIDAELRALLADLDTQIARIEADDHELEVALAARLGIEVAELRQHQLNAETGELTPPPKPAAKTTQRRRKSKS